METKSSKITRVTPNGTFPSQHGTNGLMYKFEVHFENGEYGEANCKTADQKTWVVNETVFYTLTPNQNPKYMGKLKKEQEPQNHSQTNAQANGGGFNAPEVVTMRDCIGHACRAVSGSSNCNNTAEILRMAESFYNASMAKKPA